MESVNSDYAVGMGGGEFVATRFWTLLEENTRARVARSIPARDL